MTDARTLGMLALVTCLVVAGCAGGGIGGDSAAPGGGGDAGRADDAPADGGDAAAPSEGRESADGGDGGSGGGAGSAGDADPGAVGDNAPSAAQAEPALIRTGTVVLEVEDHDRARRALVQRARRMGGYVSDSEATRHREGNRTWTTGYVVLRVPAEEYPAMMDAARGEGTVLEERSTTEDVSEQLVDLEARLENLRARRDRLRTFYERANTTEELLRIEERLSAVQGEIERLESKKAALEERVAYSTVRVELREPAPTPTPSPTPTPEPAYHETPLLSAFAASVDGVVVLGRSLLVTAAYVLPYALVVGTPFGLAGVLFWRRTERDAGPDAREDSDARDTPDEPDEPDTPDEPDDNDGRGDGTDSEQDGSDDDPADSGG